MRFIREHIKGIIGWTSFVASIVMLTLFFVYQHKDYEPIPVTGTVIAKNEGYVSAYKSTRVTSEFYMAVRPIDTSTYKSYDIKTTFLTYSTYNVGSRITFDVPKADVLIGYKTHPLGLFLLSAFLLFSTAFCIGCWEVLNADFEY